jgi:hypothetical protein
MIYSGRSPIVSSGNNPLVPNKNGSDTTPGTGGTLGYKFSNTHEVIFPGWARNFFHSFTVIIEYSSTWKTGVLAESVLF